LPDFNQMWIFFTDFHRSHQYQISQGYVHSVPCGQMDGPMEKDDEVDRSFLWHCNIPKSFFV